jgi:NADP-dependent 3-hydroxy acid dehydrogenase YdfG
MPKLSAILLIGVTSGIGSALAEHLESLSYNVVGTARQKGITPHKCGTILPLDLSSRESIDNFVEVFSRSYVWQKIIFCPAVMTPIGPFDSVKIADWLATFEINFSNQVYLLHSILAHYCESNPQVLFFAGGGTNSAPSNYSAYTLSKIALIKLVELLNEEIDHITFSILGPGWVNTKIHNQSLTPNLSDLDSYRETKRRLENSDFISMDQVISSIMWIFSQDKNVVGGRNFSTAHDPFKSIDFAKTLASNPDVFKLRRHGNHLFQPDKV